MDKRRNLSLILIFVSIAAIGIMSMKFLAKSPKVSSSTPPPVPVVEAQAPELTSVGSPDGKFTLTMKKEKFQNGLSYTFFTTDSLGVQKTIFTKTVSSGDNISIPQNTFSPDNKYVFLKEDNLGQTDYFVITPSGILDISGLFTAKYPNFKITDVTGWGGVSLVVINTNKEDDSLGPSFWFEVPGGGFIQLSTRFN